jgi:tRNA dimethylallyltransferase
VEKERSVPDKMAPGRPRPAAAIRGVTSSAGECGVKDQVSRSRPTQSPSLGARHLSLVGATATGKTAAAVRYARRHADVELVSVDAIAVYRGLDVGTAKPTPEERRGVAWHLVDCCDPAEEFSVARFQVAARAAVAGIEGRRHRAVLVGGTGLYHRSLVDDLTFPGRYPGIAAALESEADGPDGLAGLWAQLAGLDPAAASRVSPTNRRRLVRALEVVVGSGKPFSDSGPGLDHYGPTRFCLVGLRLSRDELDRRIAARLGAQLAAGFVDEVAALAAREPGLSRTARQALGYRELLEFVAGRTTLAEARAEILRRTRAFARRQEAWFRRDPRIIWLDAARADLDDALDEAIGAAGRAGVGARD